MIKILVWLLVIFLYQHRMGCGDGGISSGAVLKIVQDARLSALGGCAAALPSANSIFYNPACLGKIDNKMLSLSYNDWLMRVKFTNIAYIHPRIYQDLVLGFGLLRLATPDIDKYDSLGEKKGSWQAQDTLLIASISKLIQDGISVLVGANIKYLNSKIDNEGASAYAIDVGSLYEFEKPAGLFLGISLQNIGSKLKFKVEGFKLPFTIRGGISYKLLNDKLLLALDLKKVRDSDLLIFLGAEYSLFDILKLRAGYNSLGNDIPKGLGITSGFGIRYQQFSFDYSFGDYGIIDTNIHKISLTLNF